MLISMRVHVLQDVTLADDLWYIIETDKGVCKNRLYLRRYVDFCCLFKSLKDSTANVGGKVCYGMRRRIFLLPDLPQANWFKTMFKSWGVGSSRRVLVGLQRWLEVVLEYIATEEDEPLVEHFFGEDEVPDGLGAGRAILMWLELQRVHPGLASGIGTVQNLTALLHGTEVILKDLQNMPLYNGQLGRIMGYDQEKDSYRVVLRSGRVWNVNARFIAEYKQGDGRPLPLPVGLGDSQPCYSATLPVREPSVDLQELLANVGRPRPPDFDLAPWDEEPDTPHVPPEEASDELGGQNTKSFPAYFIASPREMWEDSVAEEASFKSSAPLSSCRSDRAPGSVEG